MISTDLRARARRGVLLLTLETWLSRLSGLIIFFLLARALEPADFGIVALASSVTVLAGILMDQGVHQAVVREPEPSEDFLNTAHWTGLGIGIGVAGLTAASAPLAAHLLSDQRLLPLVLALAPLFILNSLEVVPAAVLVRELDYAPLVRRRVLATVAGGAAAAGVAIVSGSYWALVVQSVVSATVSCLMITFGSPWRPRRAFSRVEVLRLRAFGSRLFGLNVLYTLQRQDRLLIGAALGPAALGLYTLGTRVLSLTSELVTGALSGVALPAFARLREQEGGEQRLAATYLEATRTLMAVGMPLMIGLAVAGPRLIPASFGPEWEPASGVVVWLALGGIAALATTFDHAVLLSLNRAGLELRLTLCTTAVFVVALVAGVSGGIDSLAMCVALSGYAAWAIRLSVLITRVQFLRPRSYWRAMSSILLCGLLSGATSKAVEAAAQDANIIFGTSVVVATLLLTHLLALRLLAPDVLMMLVRTTQGLVRRQRA